MTRRERIASDLWPYIGVTFGLGVSVWANVTSAAGDASQAEKHGAMILAASAPLGLFIALEILTRTKWAKDGHGAIVAKAGFVVIAASAAIVSYLHLQDLAQKYGPDNWRGTAASVIFPLFVDGLMASAAAGLLFREKEEPATSEAPKKTPDEAKRDTPPTPTPTKRAAPKRRVNGSDLREVEVVKLIRAARAAGEPDPNANQVANHIGAKWETGDKLLKKALAQVGERP